MNANNQFGLDTNKGTWVFIGAAKATGFTISIQINGVDKTYLENLELEEALDNACIAQKTLNIPDEHVLIEGKAILKNADRSVACRRVKKFMDKHRTTSFVRN